MVRETCNVLSIAGIDPSGGAGSFADAKAMSALGAYAMGVVTAITAQNTQGVQAVLPIPTDFVVKQIDSVFEDVRVDAVKIGMLFDSNLIRAVAERLQYWRPRYVVLDPVMVAKSGDKLLADSAIQTLKEELLPLATVVTPNLPEAETLLGAVPLVTDELMEVAAVDLWKLKKRNGWVFLKGGHREDLDYSEDILYDGRKMIRLHSARIPTKNTHGTGCTLSSALAALLPQVKDVPLAAKYAKEYISGAIEHADELTVGHGHGPVHHFFRIWDKKLF
jgi:hydroxymethylpyrimidine/phosphomethylpyrimidine kinase